MLPNPPNLNSLTTTTSNILVSMETGWEDFFVEVKFHSRPEGGSISILVVQCSEAQKILCRPMVENQKVLKFSDTVLFGPGGAEDTLVYSGAHPLPIIELGALCMPACGAFP